MAAATTSASVGGMAYLQGDYQRAIPYMLRAISLWDEVGFRSSTYCGFRYMLANAYQQLCNSAAALSAAEEAIATLNYDADLSLRLSCELVRGNSLSQLGRVTEAIAASEHTLELAEWLGDAALIFDALIDLATNRLDTGEFDKALQYAQRAGILCKPGIIWR